MQLTERATIVGVATGTPDGGVAIIRLSGPRAEAIGRAIYGEPLPPRMLSRRRLRLAAHAGEDALVVFMPGPRSFTGEDVVELHVHAGPLNVRSVVERALEFGAVAADAGAFSRRAFEHGRLSLDQAEGIAALIAAQTDAALEQARRLIAGELGQEVELVVARVHALRCEVEASLDFPDEVEAADLLRWREKLGELEQVLTDWGRKFESGRRSRERMRVVLAGPPNAGKSALFNALLGRDRAIVSPMPGTTRDYVEADLRVDGQEVVLVDTAGLRETSDVLEDAGVVRSREQIGGADLLVWVEAADAPELGAPAGDVVRVESKRDLGVRRGAWIGTSAAEGGVEELRNGLRKWLRTRVSDPWIGLARHRDRVVEGMAALEEVGSVLETGGLLEVAAFHLEVAEHRLAEITGRGALGPVGAEVLNNIFARFCIGK